MYPTLLIIAVVLIAMPSKCLLTKLQESIEDIKIINEYYAEQDEGINEGMTEMIPPVKYLLACISDVLNEGIERSFGFYHYYQEVSRISGAIDPKWDGFDKGLIWIIQRLNSSNLTTTLSLNMDRISRAYNQNSLFIRRKETLLQSLQDLESSVKFSLYPEDLYETRVRRRRSNSSKQSVTCKKNDDNIPENFEDVIDNTSPESMCSSFISMEAVDVKLLQERELRNDFGFFNKLKYNSVRFINNFRVARLKAMRSDFSIDNSGNSLDDEFESINIYSSENSEEQFDFEKMEICPERGLSSQNYCCTQCGNGISAKDSIKCDFSGDYLCLKCHGGKECINPLRILRNWDFRRYPIGTESRRLITAISYNNLINFAKLNPKEFKSNEKFRSIHKLREKIYKSAEKRVKAAGKLGAGKQLAALEKLAWPKTHLLTSIDLYTIEDLIEIERGSFEPLGIIVRGPCIAQMQMAAREVFIVSYCRTPLGSAFTGSLSHLSAPELASHAIKGCLAKAMARSDMKFKANEMIDEVYLGHVVSAGCGQAPATQALRLAGLSTAIPATTVNKVCASGMKAVSLGAALIRSGNANCILAGGMESMSSVPYSIPTNLRCPNRGLRFGNAELTDLLAKDGLIDAESGFAMGEAAERTADKFSISRQEMDEYAKGTFERAIESKHLFESEEIIAVPTKENPNALVISDDGPQTFKPEKMATLRTPFRAENGRVTAASSSQLTDGAAVMLLMSGEMVRELGMNPIAKIVSWADSGVCDPMEFPEAPASAIEKCLKAANMSEDVDIDLHEINEAFAIVPLVIARLNSIPMQKINVLGGSVALGHPLGASGARIIGTLLTALKANKKKRGCASICNGGGGASAIIIELCN